MFTLPTLVSPAAGQREPHGTKALPAHPLPGALHRQPGPGRSLRSAPRSLEGSQNPWPEARLHTMSSQQDTVWPVPGQGAPNVIRPGARDLERSEGPTQALCFCYQSIPPPHTHVPPRAGLSAPDTPLPSPLCPQVIRGMGAKATAVPNTKASVASSPAVGAHILTGRGRRAGSWTGRAGGCPAVAAQSPGTGTRGTAWSWWALGPPRTHISQHPGGCSSSHHHGSRCCSQMGCFFRTFQKNVGERGKERVTGQDVGYQAL